MTPQTVLLIPPNDIGWLSLQQAVASLPDVQIETAGGDAAAITQIECDLRPAAIITAARLDGASVTPVLRHLRRRLRKAIFIIVDHDVDPDALPIWPGPASRPTCSGRGFAIAACGQLWRSR